MALRVGDLSELIPMLGSFQKFIMNNIITLYNRSLSETSRLSAKLIANSLSILLSSKGNIIYNKKLAGSLLSDLGITKREAQNLLKELEEALDEYAMEKHGIKWDESTRTALVNEIVLTLIIQAIQYGKQ
ncbi:MAG: hypothetical protein DRO05_06625 [Thermoproteota archaeon]|nr:MAG: hypothetical protein DRO05_06625 [Candidatus Korarchaeota archaeon]